ncbi:MAG: hypothetical protein NC489_25615 [Ruminococcus flavefaciens]|nr:hypothetical protein [Ruminococcus flavefaciens]
MSMMDPKKVKFESQKDVIDYVTRGAPPRKKDFNALIDAIDTRDSVPEDLQEKPGTRVVIRPGLEFNMDDDALVTALNQIYINRCHNRKILMGAGMVIGAIVIAGGLHQHNRINDLEAENKKLNDIIENDMPVVAVTSI